MENNPKIDDKTHCITSSELAKLKSNTNQLYAVVDQHIGIIVKGKYPNHKFYIGKTSDYEQRFQSRGGNERIEKMFILINDDKKSDFISPIEKSFIDVSKKFYKERCNNENDGEDSLRYLYIII